MEITISREDMLTYGFLFMSRNSIANTYGWRSEKASVLASSNLQPAATSPPRLHHPENSKALVSEPALRKPSREHQAAVLQHTKSVVLLQNLPEAMVKEAMLRAMLDQANLDDVSAISLEA